MKPWYAREIERVDFACLQSHDGNLRASGGNRTGLGKQRRLVQVGARWTTELPCREGKAPHLQRRKLRSLHARQDSSDILLGRATKSSCREKTRPHKQVDL